MGGVAFGVGDGGEVVAAVKTGLVAVVGGVEGLHQPVQAVVAVAGGVAQRVSPVGQVALAVIAVAGGLVVCADGFGQAV